MIGEVHDHDEDCRSTHLTIADPGKWCGVTIDWFAVFDVIGWVYCPRSGESQPLITRATGVEPLRTSTGFIAVLKRWPGIKFGSGRPKQPVLPISVPDVIDRQSKVWDEIRLAEVAGR